MAQHMNENSTELDNVMSFADAATRAVPPMWPLSSSVAVNPYIGQSGQDLAQTAALLGRVGGLRMTMGAAWFQARLDSGAITQGDLNDALAAHPDAPFATAAEVLAQLPHLDIPAVAVPTVADLAATASGVDWPGLVQDRIGSWAAGLFDTGQALWQVPPGQGTFESWKGFASRDLVPEIMGLTGFAAHVAATPDQAAHAVARASAAMGLTAQATPTYFHQLVLGLGGWSQVTRQNLWQAELAGQTDASATDLLAVRLVWDQALLARYHDQIADQWAASLAAHAAPVTPSRVQFAAMILQNAAERGAQRDLAAKLAGTGSARAQGRPKLQAAFCIDVRSEVFRRALESLDPGIQTLGFAGFFGLTAAHMDFASDVQELRLPVLLTPGLTSAASAAPHEGDAARFAARASRAWGRFKLAAVSSFAFVEAAGPIYAGKLVRDALGYGEAQVPNARVPRLDPAMGLADRIGAAAKILGAMSMTTNFAPVVLLVGHGAQVVNTPHASALHCGACGGYSGEVNARLLAGILNEPAVREGLAGLGLHIPSDTVFLGALHDTTTDAVTVYPDHTLEQGAQAALAQGKTWLRSAGQIARTERAVRLPRAAEATIAQRSTDWAETRPEWALAGCNAFIAAPRDRTRGKALAGRAFLHDYDWTKDDGFGVLELILTAPVVVSSWITLQYYGSVVSPDTFGAGNKLLHNVTGGIGVLEGNGGALRSGLPWQSVHSGTDYAHEPLRQTVCIEAPAAAVSDILERHAGVRDLFDNHWLHLVLLDGAGQITQRYVGNLQWAPFVVPDAPGIAAVA